MCRCFNILRRAFPGVGEVKLHPLDCAEGTGLGIFCQHQKRETYATGSAQGTTAGTSGSAGNWLLIMVIFHIRLCTKPGTLVVEPIGTGGATDRLVCWSRVDDLCRKATAGGERVVKGQMDAFACRTFSHQGR